LDVDRLIRARREAEAAVKDMPEGDLKNTAFATILAHRLGQGTAPVPPSPSPTRTKARSATNKAGAPRREGTTARLLRLVEEGFFAQPRSLADIKAALAERGWHYQVESLGTPVTRLVQSKHKYLRRTQIAEGGKKIWKYSNY